MRTASYPAGAADDIRDSSSTTLATGSCHGRVAGRMFQCGRLDLEPLSSAAS